MYQGHRSTCAVLQMLKGDNFHTVIAWAVP